MPNPDEYIDILLDDLKREIINRNAVDYLEHLVECFEGHFGSWLVSNQIAKDRYDCPECVPDDDLDAGIIE